MFPKYIFSFACVLLTLSAINGKETEAEKEEKNRHRELEEFLEAEKAEPIETQRERELNGELITALRRSSEREESSQTKREEIRKHGRKEEAELNAAKRDETEEEERERPASARREQIETQRRRELRKELLRKLNHFDINRLEAKMEKDQIKNAAKRAEMKVELEEREKLGAKRELTNVGEEEEINIADAKRESKKGEKESVELEKERPEKREENELEENEKIVARETKSMEQEQLEAEKHEHESRREERIGEAKENDNTIALKREFKPFKSSEEEEEENKNIVISKRGFPKWMKALEKQFPHYRNQVTCALKEMQAALRGLKAMKNYKIHHCDNYFRCRGSRDAVTKCGDYSWAVTVMVSKSRQWRTSGADPGYDSKSDVYGRKKGDCIKRYIYDTMATKKPCFLPYGLFK